MWSIGWNLTRAHSAPVMNHAFSCVSRDANLLRAFQLFAQTHTKTSSTETYVFYVPRLYTTVCDVLGDPGRNISMPMRRVIRHATDPVARRNPCDTVARRVEFDTRPMAMHRLISSSNSNVSFASAVGNMKRGQLDFTPDNSLCTKHFVRVRLQRVAASSLTSVTDDPHLGLTYRQDTGKQYTRAHFERKRTPAPNVIEIN
jgi:hypothetical protein